MMAFPASTFVIPTTSLRRFDSLLCHFDPLLLSFRLKGEISDKDFSLHFIALEMKKRR